jgi:hypothetical protein
MGFPFVPAPPEAIPGAAGATHSIEFNKVESYEQLATALSVDAKAEARYGLFSADMSFSFENSMSMNSYSIYVYAVANVERAFTQIPDPKYKPEAAALVKQGGGSRAFRAAYGDWFVRGMATGGQIMSLIEIRTHDETNRQDIDASLSGSYGVAFSGEVNLKEKFSKAVGTSNTHIVQHQVGGTPRHIETPDQVFDEITAFVDELAAPNCDTAVAYQVGCVPYETVPIPDAPPWVDVEQAEQSLDLLAQMRKGHLRVLADVQYVLTNQSEFVWGPEPERAELIKKLNAASKVYFENLSTIQQTASAIAKDLTTPLDLKELVDYPDVALPSRSPGEVKPEETSSQEPRNLKHAMVNGLTAIDPSIIGLQGFKVLDK